MAVKLNASAAVDPPRILSHYTNLEGAVGIIGNGEFWASNVAYLNDREELEHGLNCARSILPSLKKDANTARWIPVLTQVLDGLDQGRMPNTYAACFCRTSDLLSQWRGYGGKEQGLCLSFDREMLADLRPGKSALTKVIYGKVAGKRETIDSLKSSLGKFTIAQFNSMSDEDRREEAYSVISSLAPRLKHIGFQGEREWRFIVQQKTLRSEACFRPSGRVIVPYLKIRKSDARLPLTSVTIGPGGEMDLTKKSVEVFLKAKGYDVPIRLSRVPFRT